MTTSQIVFASAVLVSLQPALAGADQWNVSQKVTPKSNVTLTQEDNSGALQAMNAVSGVTSIAGDGADDQHVNMTAHTLKLLQDKNTATSSQAANYLQVNKMAAGTSFIQKYESISPSPTALQLIQGATLTGGGNDQAVNTAKVTNDFTELTQQLSMYGTAILSQETNTSGNQQALNLVDSATIGVLSQMVTLAINAVNMTMSQKSSGNSNLQAVNAVVEAGAVNTSSTQIVSIGATPQIISLTQDGTGSTNVQAINSLSAKGTVASAIQRFENLGATVTLQQYSGSNSEQGVNRIDITASAGAAAGTQSIDVKSLNLTQGKVGGAVLHDLQTGNSFLTAATTGNGTISQTVSTLLTSNLSQSYTTDSLQAFNYVGRILY